MDEIDFIQPKKTVGKLISVDVLDKIRSEITECATYLYFECGGSQEIVELEDVLEIIDKYKSESEVEER